MEIVEKRMDDQEQNSRINYLIISGLKIKTLSCAHAVTAWSGEESNEEKMNSMEKQVENLIKSKGISLDANICLPLPGRRESDKPAILSRFVNQKHKAALLKHGRGLKGTNVFMNDNLTNGMLTSPNENAIGTKKCLEMQI